MTIGEVIHLAQRWQEAASEPVGDCKQEAHRFSFALVMVDIERQAAMALLADLGATGETLCDRIKALAAQRGGKS